MFEIPETVTQIEVVPLVDNAKFSYLDETYSFGEITDKTVGMFTVATSDDQGSAEKQSFVIENEPELSFFELLIQLIISFFMSIFSIFG